MSRLFDLDFQLLADTVLMIIEFLLFLVASHFLIQSSEKALNDRKEKIKENDQAASDQKSAAQTRASTREAESGGQRGEAILADGAQARMEN